MDVTTSTPLTKMSQSNPIVDKTHLLQEYCKQLSEREQIVLKIASEHLETSFNLERSIGFAKWMKNRTQ